MQVTVKVKVTPEGYFLLLLYIYNMSSELNLLELYLNLLEHRNPRFSDVFAPYRGFGEFSEHMIILEIRQIYAGGLKTVLVKLTSLRTCKFLFFMNHFQLSY